MRRKSLLWQLFSSFFLVTFLSLLLVTAYASRSLRQFYLDQTAQDLRARALLWESRVAGLIAAEDLEGVQDICERLGERTGTRLTVILPSGSVLADSDEDPHQMDNHADRPEIIAAFRGEADTAVRFSYTLQQEMMYVAVPEQGTRQPGYVVRTSLSLAAISSALHAVYGRIVLAGLVLTLIASAISYGISRRLSRSLNSLREGAERYARGDLGHRLRAPDTEEIGALANSMNTMAAQLDDRIRTIERQRNELEAVLASMVEGVLAVDTEENIISLNRAAARLLGIQLDQALGRSVLEIVRNPELFDFVKFALSENAPQNRQPVEMEIVFHGDQELFLQAHASSLHGAAGEKIGALVVLNDVTSLRRLETVRRDFVANVSHELRTPITSVKGFVETLLENPPENPQERERFLRIVATHADRLNAIIEDLLSLSRIEQETEKAEIVLTAGKVADVILSAVDACTAKAESRRISIEHTCTGDTVASINPPLLEQAVVNLIDNAIKYSEPGSGVQVKCSTEEHRVSIAIHDQGCGIASEHLPRLFERFYRVDKARSRKLGGTGLGLAIVKHIVQAHGGEIAVESALGRGSTFTIHLPQH
jgi:two-component system phosphate regulon sensor histidine kinase PhoR